MSLIGIVIPNYNGIEHLKTCYASLKTQSFKDFKVILADNGSKDESVKFTKAEFSDSVIIDIGYNSGFAKAVNEGIKAALKIPELSHVLLLNNDMGLDKDFLLNAFGVFGKYPDASSVAVKMLNYFNREIIDNTGDFINGHGGSPIARGHAEKDTGQYDKTEYVFAACGGGALYKKEIFDIAGFFDETFFAYFEDVDFGFRLQILGFKCVYEPTAVCYHKRGGTSSIATHGFQTEMCERNLVMMRFKNYPLSQYILFQPLFFIARLRRYFKFAARYSISLAFKAFRGYIRGQFLIWTKIGERFRIQRSRKVSKEYIKKLFI